MYGLPKGVPVSRLSWMMNEVRWVVYKGYRVVCSLLLSVHVTWTERLSGQMYRES